MSSLCQLCGVYLLEKQQNVVLLLVGIILQDPLLVKCSLKSESVTRWLKR